MRFKKDKRPEIYSAILIVDNALPEVTDEHIYRELEDIGVGDIRVTRPKSGDYFKYVLAEIRYEKSWSVDEVLRLMFEKTASYYAALVQLVTDKGYRVVIDVAFGACGHTWPAVCLEGDIMQKIRELKANISIDILA